MIAEKQEQLATLREKTRAFRSGFRFAFWVQLSLWTLTTDDCLENNEMLCRECLSEEEVQSTKMNQNRRH